MPIYAAFRSLIELDKDGKARWVGNSYSRVTKAWEAEAKKLLSGRIARHKTKTATSTRWARSEVTGSFSMRPYRSTPADRFA